MDKSSLRKIGNAVVLPYKGVIEEDTKNITEEFIADLMDRGETDIALDMQSTRKFLSSSITHLIKIMRAVEKRSGKLYLVSVPDPVVKVLSMVNIIAKFNVFLTERELESALSGSEFVSGIGPSKDVFYRLKKSVEGKEHIISIEGSFIEGTDSEALLEEVRASLGQGAGQITLDFKKTKVLDTISVGTLLKAHQKCKEQGVKLRAVNPNSVVKYVLEMNDVAKLFGL